MFSGPKQIEKLKRGDIVFLSEIITHSMYWQEISTRRSPSKLQHGSNHDRKAKEL